MEGLTPAALEYINTLIATATATARTSAVADATAELQRLRAADALAAAEVAAAAAQAAAPTDIAAQFAGLINQLATTLAPPPASPPPPLTAEERQAYNVWTAKGFVSPAFSHWPTEARGDRPGVFSLFGERTHQYLTDNKKTAAAEEYSVAYASALFQCCADQALETYLRTYLESEEGADDKAVLRPILDLIHRNAACALQRLTLLRIKSGAFPQIDVHFQNIASRTAHTDNSEWAVDPVLAALHAKHERAVQTAGISAAAKFASQGTRPQPTRPPFSQFDTPGGGRFQGRGVGGRGDRGGRGREQQQQQPAYQEQQQRQQQEPSGNSGRGSGGRGRESRTTTGKGDTSRPPSAGKQRPAGAAGEVPP
jgi:hypothetical protein